MICPSKLHFESVGWIGCFFFKSSNGFKVREINLYQEREGMFFIYNYTIPCEFIWQAWFGGGRGCCVGGRKINPPIPTVSHHYLLGTYTWTPLYLIILSLFFFIPLVVFLTHLFILFLPYHPIGGFFFLFWLLLVRFFWFCSLV
jgi:hypothetical protein